jgi:uncharacterized protein with beta-barrel porin domain
MKKVLVTLIVMTLALGVFAQDSTNAMNKMAPKQNMQKHEGVMMKDGKLLMMKNGQTTQLTTDLTLDNGAVVMTNGTLKAKDGKTTVLKEGDYVSMDGTKMGNMATWKKEHMGQDSTMGDKMKTDSVR